MSFSTATAHLTAADPALGAHIARVGRIKRDPPLFQEPYHALLAAVAHQQLHDRAASAIIGRMKALTGGDMPAPTALLALPDEALRGCGFSASKTAYIRDIAIKAAEGVIPSRARAMHLSDSELVARLTTIRGVGQWTVEMLLIFTLRRPDVFPVDDFGVREGYRLIQKLDVQPKPRVFAVIGQAYAPYRSTASLYLWRAANLAKPLMKAK